MRVTRSIALLFLAFFLLPAALAAQVGVTTDIIRGRVTGADGRPVQGAQVEAVSLEGEVRRTAATDAQGRYTIVFPEGGGRYRVRVAMLGMAPVTRTVAREADEDVLVADFRLGEQAIALQGIEARADRTPPPGRGEAGAQERTLGSELVARLPLEDNDPARLAALAPGVVAAQGDSLEARGAFSVAGQRSSQNQVTLDGTSFASALTGGQAGGGSPLGIPQEGIRATQVVTSTYDVARGQFSGGQVAMTTRAGTNRVQGSFSYLLRDPTLQGGVGRASWGGGFTQNRLSGGIGGPIVRDRLFYFLSFSGQRRTDDLFALTPDDPGVVEELGVSADSIARFLGILQTGGASGRTGEFSRTGDAVSLLGRVDYNLTQRHTLALRGHLNLYDQANARIGFLETLGNGGDVGTEGKGGILTLTSRFGAGWINELRASVNDDRREQESYDAVPEGRVRVSSELGADGRGVATLVFGGDRSLPTNTRETTLELSNELSFLFRDQHRIKLGGLFNHTGFEQQNTLNRLGSFEFPSLEAFAAGTPSRFTRSLAERATEGAGLNAAVYLGDTWRPTQRLQLTFGLRGEGSRFDREPAGNPLVVERFGRRTDRFPTELHVSPRAGFSWRLNEQGTPLKMIRGGFGEFRGRAPFSLFANALDQTGLANGESQLVCVGEGVPTPDWAAYEADPASIPTTCANGAPPVVSTLQPNVTVFSEDFGAPRSWRGSLGYQTQLFGRFAANLDVSQSWGVSLYGVRDLNLLESPAFVVDEEGGRPVFARPEGIVPATGEVALSASRRFPEFAHVFEVNSALRSTTTQVTVGLSGFLPRRVLFNANYTWSRSRDQSSFSSGSPFFGFQQVPVAESPNAREWGRSDFERRHQVVATLGFPFSQAFEVTAIGRVSSGTPFTPLVGGDVNGDGARNDRAFVFAPGTAPDTALAGGMARLLDAAPGRVRDCLRGQTGEIAGRNSCFGPWSASLDLRGTVRPQLPNLGRRLSISIDMNNVPAALDQLLHGSGDLRGWGQAGFGGSDPVLLYPRGFDPAAQRFTYQVNEQFGQTRTRRAGFGSPFTVQLSARITVGAQQGQGGFGMAGIAFGGMGGMGGGEGRGGFGGPGGPGGQGFDVEALLDRVLPEPVSAILLLRDTLGITPEQAARLEAVQDTLEAKNDPIREEIRRVISAAGANPNPGEVFQRIGPQLNRGRQNVQAALDSVRRVLTPEQWRRVPAALRNPLGGFGPGGGGPGGGRPRGEGQQQPQGERPRQGGEARPQAQPPAQPQTPPATPPAQPQTPPQSPSTPPRNPPAQPPVSPPQG